MSIRSVVLSEIQVVATEQKKTLAPLNDDAPLLNLGLDSLCFAILVARLEEKLERDPFASADEVEFPSPSATSCISTNMRSPDIATLWGTLAAGEAAGRVFSDRDASFDPSVLIGSDSFAGRLSALAGLSVLIAPRGQVAAGSALIQLDGLVRRLVIAPPDLKREDLPAVLADAEIDAIVCDGPDDFGETGLPCFGCAAPIAAGKLPSRAHETEWVLLTSGTTGRPKMVVHTLAGLTGAIGPSAPGAVWATFYDIRRYGGLQIFLRALLGGGSLIMTSENEAVADHLARLGAGGVTHISGTPSHWRRVLMSQANGAMAPTYVRLSGEIADQAILDSLRAVYPRAKIGHAYASTEAGVGFAVDDGLEGFPVAFTERTDAEVSLKVEDGSLRIRSNRTASRYVGPGTKALADADGYVDTGDMLERRGERYYFVGRRGGIVNVGGLKVHPEEVEAALNSHPLVNMSLVTARKNPFTGSIVVADVVLDASTNGDLEALKMEMLAICRAKLDRHKVPVSIRVVPSLEIAPSGKVRRAHA